MKAHNLKQQVVTCLKTTTLPMSKVADGSGVTNRHLYKIRKGETQNPRVDEVQRIYDFFVANPGTLEEAQ